MGRRLWGVGKDDGQSALRLRRGLLFGVSDLRPRNVWLVWRNIRLSTQ